ncbi:hypothetical protein MAGR_50750 [Mycolicibacterium agri]|uniref:HTH araC/xylS-type domain-containing protein n=1 Tax=Mycolicibacterium agri TaxID=36811 RepID=A0A7I9W7G5_MYCAG|nr:hypothetical protein MAGR_50750 [Mycolicibacterium agri]
MLRTTVSTTDSDEAYGLFRQIYVDHQPVCAPADENFHMTVSTGTADTVCGGHLRGAMRYRGRAEPAAIVTMGVLAGGCITFRSRREECACGAGDAMAVMFDERSEFTVEDPDVVTLQVPLVRVTQAAQVNFGTLQEDFRLHSVRPVSPTMNEFFARVVHMVTTQLLSPEGLAFEYPLVARQLVDVVITALLNGFANSTMTVDYRPEPGKISAAAVRRAVDYIDEHAAEPIGAADIAAATGTEARELQATFVREHELTPMEYLRRVRLNGAHHDLQTCTPDGDDAVATVAAIAHRWGFVNQRLFSALYRAAFGRAPGITLGEDPP